jgi:hypothetical protein
VEVKHGPAEGVTPVFVPIKPEIESNLFVFFHIKSLV